MIWLLLILIALPIMRTEMRSLHLHKELRFRGAVTAFRFTRSGAAAMEVFLP